MFAGEINLFNHGSVYNDRSRTYHKIQHHENKQKKSQSEEYLEVVHIGHYSLCEDGIIYDHHHDWHEEIPGKPKNGIAAFSEQVLDGK